MTVVTGKGVSHETIGANAATDQRGRNPMVTGAPYLYDHNAVGLAAFLGTPIAGSILMALNYRRLAKPLAAAAVLTWGVAFTALMLRMASTWTFKATFDRASFGSLGSVIVAKLFQRALVERHVRSGGALGSTWEAVQVGLAGLLVILVGAVLLQ